MYCNHKSPIVSALISNKTKWARVSSQRMNESINQSMNQLVSQWINESMNESINQ